MKSFKVEKEAESKDEATSDNTIIDIIGRYPEYLAKYGKKTYGPARVAKYKKYIRFGKGLMVSISDVDREDAIEIINANSPNLGYLFRNTDLKDSLPDKIRMDRGMLEQYRYYDLVQVLNYADLEKFCQHSKKFFAVNTWDFFSVFLKNGKQFRAYANTLGLDAKQVFFCQGSDARGSINPKEIFSCDKLQYYCEQKREPEIYAMVEEVHEFAREINRISKSTSVYDSLNDVFYDRLFEMHPELIK